jgi:hypothetical protein
MKKTRSLSGQLGLAGVLGFLMLAISGFSLQAQVTGSRDIEAVGPLQWGSSFHVIVTVNVQNDVDGLVLDEDLEGEAENWGSFVVSDETTDNFTYSPMLVDWANTAGPRAGQTLVVRYRVTLPAGTGQRECRISGALIVQQGMTQTTIAVGGDEEFTVGGGNDRTYTYGLARGWYMVSVPLNSGTASDLFGTTAYCWNPAAGQYDVVSTIDPVKGYWVYIPASKSVTDSGSHVTSDVTSDVSTAGWHQISTPWSYPKSAIQVIRGTETKAWTNAVAAGWMRDAIYSYKATDGAYTTPSTMNPWYGYWVKAKVSGLILVLLHASGTPACTSVTAPLAFTPMDLPPMPLISVPLSANDLEFVNYPNPITDVHTTTFMVKGPMAALVEAIKVHIFDLSGKLVYESGEIPGTSLDWHTENQIGETLANGVYLYRMYALIGEDWVESEVKKLVILR